MTLRNLPAVTVETRSGHNSALSESVVARWNPGVRAADESANAISILDPIGADFFGDGVTAKRIAAVLRNIGGDPVVVNINSPGGDFFEGLAIYNLLREYSGEVEVRVLGMAASAASIIAMAGDTIKMGRATFLMIHNTRILAYGDQAGLRDVADWLAPFDEALNGIYVARTGLPAPEIQAMLDRETWINSEAAVDQGFADEVLASDAAAGDVDNRSDLTELAATKKLHALLTGRVSQAERRKLVAALKSGKPSAANPGTPSDAGLAAFAADALAKIKNL